VRLKAGGLGDGWWHRLGRFGHVSAEAGWVEIDGIDPARVADLVAEVVGLGGRVEAVIPEHPSLEARFLELLGAP
jgi:hypothetical protein